MVKVGGRDVGALRWGAVGGVGVDGHGLGVVHQDAFTLQELLGINDPDQHHKKIIFYILITAYIRLYTIVTYK